MNLQLPNYCRYMDKTFISLFSKCSALLKRLLILLCVFISAQTFGQIIIIPPPNILAPTTTTLSSTVNPSIAGQPVLITATVTSLGTLPLTGTVDFYNNTTGTDVTPGGVPIVNGKATYTTPILNANVSITATYSGDAANLASTSAAFAQTVNQPIIIINGTFYTTATTLVSSANPSVAGSQPVTFTATVSSSGGPTPIGTVDFYDNTNNKDLTPGGVPLSNGIAAFTTSSLPFGDLNITATYNGDANGNQPSTSNGLIQHVLLTISGLDVTVHSSSAGNTSAFGDLVTFNAIVSSGVGAPLGSVTFADNGFFLGTATIDGSGIASFKTSILTVGSHSITANYFSKTSTALIQTVNPYYPPTTISLGIPNLPHEKIIENLGYNYISDGQPVYYVGPDATYGQPVTFVANLSGATGYTPTGSVTFFAGDISLGTVGLDAGGNAIFTTSILSVGDNTISMYYSGDENYAAQDFINNAVSRPSPSVRVTVDPSSTTTIVSSNLNPSIAGQQVTFIASVPSPFPSGNAIPPTGDVTFNIDGVDQSPVPLQTGNGGRAFFDISSLRAGSHTIKATYSGDGNYNGGSSGSITQVVGAVGDAILNYLGDSQSTPVNTFFPNGLMFDIININPKLAGGAAVTFTAPSSGASGTFSNGTNSITVHTTTLGSVGDANSGPFKANGIAGSYTVTASIPGLGTDDFTLTNTSVVTVPYITNSGETSVCSGTNSTLLTLSNYTGTIQWQSSPDNISFTNITTNATDPTYTATNLTATTWYRAVVTSGGTSATSSSVAVTVSEAPTITTDVTTTPYNITQNGISPILGVLASGSNLTYQWYSNTINSNTGGTAIAGATVSSFIPDVHTVGTSYYYASVGGSCGSVKSSAATVIVNPAATPVAGIISGGGGTVCSGTNSTFLILNGYTGTIQWQSSPDNATFTDITRATNAFYTATNLTASSWYRTVVSSGSTSVTSRSVEVTVTPNASAGTVTAGTTPQCIGSTTTYTVSGAVLAGGAGAWSSSNTAVATVDASTGVVTAVGAGISNIVYTVTGGCGGIVTSQQSYTVTPNASAGTVTAGTSPQCIASTTTYTVSDAVLAGGTGAWSSSNTAVATVDASTGVVTAIGAGTANIVYTVTGSCGVPVSASQPYTVTPNAFAGIVNTVIRPQCIGSNTLYSVSYAVLGGGTGAWSSSDTSIARVATVDASTAFVTAVGAGTTNIVYTVTGGCGGIVTSQQSYVVNPATIITASPVNVSTPALDNTSFTVAASGAGTLSYQWQVSTDAGNSFTNLADNTVYSGTSGTVLNLPNVVYSMNGYEYQCVVKGSCGDATSTPATLTVTKRPTVITYTGDDNEQYSDQQTLTATLSDQETNTVLASQPVSFTLGTQSVATATDATGTATSTLNMYQDAGAYNVVSSFAGDNTYAASSDTDPFTIKQENAITDYTGPEFVSVPCATCATTPVLLSASVIDTTALYPLNDKYPGDIRKARVKFVNLDNMTDISDWLTPGLVNAADTTNGIVSYNWTVNLPTTGYDTYTIGVVVDGNYIGGSQSVLSVSRSSLTQFITGGGHLVPASSGGQYASDAGRKVNFGFNVKYNKTGKNLQGNMNIIFRRAGHVYQIKATSMTSLSVNTTNPCSQKATFVSKANLIDITDENNPISVYGGITLQVTLTDNGEPGSSDLIGITLLNNNTLIYSSNWVSKKTTEMLLNGGNLVVNSGVVCSNTIATRNEAVMVTEQTPVPSAISANAYPNPLRDQTSIVYTLPATMHINLAVYDIMGKKIAELQDASETAGVHTVKFVTGNHAAGVYFYSLTALDDKGKLTVINGKLIIGR
jgi:hypothetical protein